MTKKGRRLDIQNQHGRVVSFDEYFENLSDAQASGLVAAALEIEERRRAKLDKIRDLLLAKNDQEALRLIREFLNIET